MALFKYNFKDVDELWSMRDIEEIDFLEQTSIMLLDITWCLKGKKIIVFNLPYILVQERHALMWINQIN